MRPKSAWAILALSLCVGGFWAIQTTPAQSQDADLADQRGEYRPASSLELGLPYSISAQYEFEQQCTSDERASLVKLNSRYAIADPDCPLPTSERQPFYLKLREPMSRAFARRLQDAGVSFVGYAYPHTHFVRARGAGARDAMAGVIRNSPVVLGTLLREPMDGMDEYAYAHYTSADFEGGAFRIMPWRDIEPGEFEQTLLRAGAAIEFATRDATGAIDLETPFIDCFLSSIALRALGGHPDIEWIEPVPTLVTYNVDSRDLSNAGDSDVGVNSPYNLTGAGLIVGVWDGGTARDTHDDFQNAGTNSPINNGSSRVLRVDTSSINSHPTHVTGTIVGDGASNASARGYAPEAYALSHDWNNMNSQRLAARHNYRHVADNHSYGNGGGGNGGYDGSAQTSDLNIRDVWLNMCKAAGNDGSGSNTVTDDGCMKNSLTIGATSDGGNIANFSSRGPTDDGRLIPHFAANGVALTSTGPNHDSHYLGGSTWSGTSMSSPSVCGTVTLLAQQWMQTMNNRQLAPDVTRGILAATAIDQYHQGPDYRYGFGIVDCKRAVDLVIANGQTGGRHVVRGTIRQGDVVEYDVQVNSSSQPLKVVCSWIDIWANTGSGTKLVNDIDIELIEPNGSTTHYPWSGLTSGGSGNQTHQWTRTGPNRRDNIELVEVDNPATGTWTIRVTGHSLPANPQNQVLNDATGFVLVSENQISKAQETFEDSLNTSGPIAIPNNNPGGLSRTFSVSNTNAIENVRLYVDIRHTARGDIDVYLDHPDGTTVHVETSDTSGRDDIIGIFPDTRQYDDDTEILNGKPANGTWTVRVTDNRSGNTGTLEYLALEIDYDTVNPPANQPPTADAGPDQVVDEGDTVNLSGSGTDPDGDTLSFAWAQVSGPSVTLANPNTQTPSFVAPQVSSQEVVVIRLTVDDGNGAQDTDDVSITVNDVPAPNQDPVADAGVNFSITEGVSGQLNGTNSSDPDGDSLTFSWAQLSGPSISLSGSTTSMPTFTAPQVSSATDAVFELTVNDGNGGSDTDTVTVTILDSSINNPPTASAGDDFYTAHGSLTQLDGTQSSDPDGDPLTFSWVQISGANTVTITNASTSTPTFTAPGTDDTLTFELTVDDGNGNFSNDFVTVTVNATGQPDSGQSGSSGGGGGDDDGGCSTGQGETWLFITVLALLAVRAAARRRGGVSQEC